MGTFVTVSVPAGPRAAAAADAALRDVARLEAMLSVHSPASALSRLNAAPAGRELSMPRELHALLRLALRARRRSRAAFDPCFADGVPPSATPFVLRRDGRRRLVRKTLPVRIDLSGIAKGYAVDRAVAVLRRRLPRAAGCVDAGGDLRFFGPGPRRAALRVGPARRPVLVPVRLRADALACSSPAYARATPASSTRYARRARAAAAAASAPTCALADALTKVGLFADARTARACAESLGGRILRFDGAGRPRP